MSILLLSFRYLIVSLPKHTIQNVNTLLIYNFSCSHWRENWFGKRIVSSSWGEENYLLWSTKELCKIFFPICTHSLWITCIKEFKWQKEWIVNMAKRNTVGRTLKSLQTKWRTSWPLLLIQFWAKNLPYSTASFTSTGKCDNLQPVLSAKGLSLSPQKPVSFSPKPTWIWGYSVASRWEKQHKLCFICS